MNNNMMMQAMQALQQMQQQVAATNERLKTMAITETGGDGMVSVTVTGELRIVNLKIDREKLDEDHAMVEDLLISTINKALAAAEQMKERELGSATQGMMPDIPGLGSLFGGE